MTGPSGNSLLCYTEIRGKQNYLFPEGSVICHKAGNFEGGDSSSLAVTAVVGQHSRAQSFLAGNSFIVRYHVTSK